MWGCSRRALIECAHAPADSRRSAPLRDRPFTLQADDTVPRRSRASASCRRIRSARPPALRTSRFAIGSSGYRAGDLERRYPRLPIEEDFFVNYGFLPREIHALMHPRKAAGNGRGHAGRKAQEVLDFVREKGVVHPREVDAHFEHGKTTNWFGGSSNASTQLLDGMHYRGLLRIARREGGHPALRGARDSCRRPRTSTRTMDRLVDVVVNKYAPLPATTLSGSWSCCFDSRSRTGGLERKHAVIRAKARLPNGQGRGPHVVLA
ncbi:MAG: crosslink repair DNA glycosylase YcaQ family protein [Paludibaculum sp.]